MVSSEYPNEVCIGLHLLSHSCTSALIVVLCCCRDPSGTALAFADMMKKQIVMPAHMMNDMVHKGRTGRNIFQDFSTVAESTGTYTAQVCTHCILSCLLVKLPSLFKTPPPPPLPPPSILLMSWQFNLCVHWLSFNELPSFAPSLFWASLAGHICCLLSTVAIGLKFQSASDKLLAHGVS